MTRVDFYLLNGMAQREPFVCRLIDKALQNDNQVYVHAASREQALALDELLWTFRPGSFIAHELVESGTAPAGGCAVLLGYGYEPAGEQPVLINLHHEVPVFFSRFERVLEIVNDDEHIKREGRARYGYYRDRGYALQHHNVTV